MEPENLYLNVLLHLFLLLWGTMLFQWLVPLGHLLLFP